MNWESIESLCIDRRRATLWSAKHGHDTHYCVTLDRSEDMIVVPRDYEASDSREDAITMAKLRHVRAAQ